MRKGLVLFLILPALAAAVSTWKDYPINTPAWCKHIYSITVNNAGDGCAFMGDGVSSGKEYALHLHNGVWSPCAAPPVMLAWPSISPDGTIYSISNGENNNIYRFDGGFWKWVAASARFGQFGFSRVAAVGPHEFWTLGATREGMVKVIYFENDQPNKIFDIGPYGDGIFSVLGDIVVPRTASPGGACYVFIRAETYFKPFAWLMFILQPDGTKRLYEFPFTGYYCDGLSAYNLGDVHVMMSGVNGGASRLFSFADGVWRELLSFPERVHLADYASPADGWGINFPNKRIYHWTGAAITPAVALDGDVISLGMVGPREGWAVGSRMVKGVRRPAMWRYTDEDALTPTSLGRVKAAFK